MKKLLTALLAAGLLTAVVAAEMPKAEQFEANNGFYYGPNKSEVVQDEEHRSIPTVEDTDAGVKITHKGYFQTNENCGGVHSVDMYDLNGLSITVSLERVPEVPTGTDCWFAIDFLDKPEGFSAGGGNLGIKELIRFANNGIEFHCPDWTGVGNAGSIDASDAEAFGLKSGDIINIVVNRNEAGLYTMTYTCKGKTIELPAEFDLTDVLPDGKAYICVVGSCELGDQGDFIYTITDLTNGTEMSEEEKAAIAEAKAAAELAEKTASFTGLLDTAKAALEEVRADYAGYEDADALIAEADEAITEAEAAIEAGEFDSVQGFIDTITDKAVEAKNAGKQAEKNGAEKVTAEEETNETEEEPTEGPAPTEKVKETNSNTGLIIGIIAAIVVVIAVIAVLLGKKKKN